MNLNVKNDNNVPNSNKKMFDGMLVHNQGNSMHNNNHVNQQKYHDQS